jgi:hypothetical protein
MNQVDFVVQIHSALAVQYGRRWPAMWAGLDMDLVRADWRRKLQEFAGNPAAVMHALDNLPDDHVPTASEFRALCRAAPRPAWQPLPSPATSERGKAAMRELVARARAEGCLSLRGKSWSARVIDRVAGGEPVSPTVRAMALAAQGGGSSLETPGAGNSSRADGLLRGGAKGVK